MELSLQLIQNFFNDLIDFNNSCQSLVDEYNNKFGKLSEEVQHEIENLAKTSYDFVLNHAKKHKDNFISLMDDINQIKCDNFSVQTQNSNLVTKKLEELICTQKIMDAIQYNEFINNEEIDILKINSTDIFSKVKILKDNFYANEQQIQNAFWGNLKEFRDDRSAIYNQITQKKRQLITKQEALEEALESDIEKLVTSFLAKYPSDELNSLVYTADPIYEYEQTQCTQVPQNIWLGKMNCLLDNLCLNIRTQKLINENYYYLVKHLGYEGDNKQVPVITFPYIQNIDNSFNCCLELTDENYEQSVQSTCSTILKLLTQIPSGKVNFTFIDPISQGETFAVFTRIVDTDDKSSKIINGKIWVDSKDIEAKLRIITDQIANTIQRYLQGKYVNISEYNIEAEENAEPYHFIIAKDFPAGFTEKSLEYLEKIITTGAKCGVFVFLLTSHSQTQNTDRKLYNIIERCYKSLNVMAFKNGLFTHPQFSVNNNPLYLSVDKLPTNDYLDILLPQIKNNLKKAEHIVIRFSKILPPKETWFTYSCISELIIPIGIHGANQVQNLVLGSGENHHALIAGQIGSGKSSLLHTIIMSALIKYPSNQLQVFLVDFKRGVEFKIYANHKLENFRVIATESEREFGCSVLAHLDKEQAIRAEKFKRYNVDNLESYCDKSGEILPRILLIIDEFHVLFSKDSNDTYAKDSAMYLEQIIRQGRAFGIHVILASQTVSGISTINHGVWGQIGIRIALKCSKNDARFILGNDNDGVDLLSPDNPGQAIYNSDGGNIVANTMFRVAYLDQDEQEGYLNYISDNAPAYDMPDPRIMLSNIEDNIHNPFQKYVQNRDFDFSSNQIIVGESLKVINNLKIVFKRTQNSNLLVIGNDELKARTLFTFAVLSLAIHCKTMNNSHIPDTAPIYLFDFAPLEDDYEKDILLELTNLLPHYVRYIPYNESDTAIKELYQAMILRENSTSDYKDMYMLVYGLQRARNFRSSDVYKQNATYDDFDEFGDTPNKSIIAKPYEMFLNILQRGSMVGISSLIWQDNFKVFMNYYADMLDNFDMRIAFTMPDDDSISFIETSDGSSISDNGAIFNYRGNQKFRPYKKPDLSWLKNISVKLENN